MSSAGAAKESGSGDLLSTSAIRIAARIARREISCAEVMRIHLARIEAVNGALNAVVAIDAAHAIAAAEAADRKLSQREPCGPLHGVPVTIKDSFDVAGMISTAGTEGRRSFVPDRDATVVRRLREAGAIVIGKTNTPELTMGSGTENVIYGRTYNPYDLTKAPSGSSGGAAAIVAAGGSALDIGSDTGGSIRSPAHVCGVAGLKPTVGRVPLTGHVISYDFGFVEFLTQVGPIARYVEDLSLALSVIAGPDGVDPLVAPVPIGEFGPILPARLRVAWFTGNGRVSATPAVAAATRAAAAALKDRGAEIVETVPPRLAELEDIYGRLRDADGGSSTARLLQRCGTEHLTAAMRSRIDRAKPLDGAALSALFEKTQQLRSFMLRFMDGFDILLCPPELDVAQPYDGLEKSTYEDWAFQTTFNVTGWPAVVVRAGQTESGLPVGVQIVAGPWREALALGVAKHIEEALGGYFPPPISAAAR